MKTIRITENKLRDIIKNSLNEYIIRESHGVSNAYLDKLCDFILANRHEYNTIYPYDTIAYCFVDFPENLKPLFKNVKLEIVPNSKLSNGHCDYNVRRKLIQVSLRLNRDENEIKTTLYHELTHMIDYVVNHSSKGDFQTKTFSKYNDKFINGKSQYREFSHIIYGFTTLEMRGRLASFKEMLKEWLNNAFSEDRNFNSSFVKGYNSLFNYFKNEIQNTQAYKYAIGRYEELYNDYIKKCNYNSFGYKGTIELYNNLYKVIDPSGTPYKNKEISNKDYDDIKLKVCQYFDNIIANYKKQLYKVSLDVWYDYIDNFSQKYGNTPNFKKFMKSETIR